MYKEVEAKPDQIDDKEFNIREADTPPTLESILNERVIGVQTCDFRCLFSGYKGEVCCIEPLHTKTELCDHPITNYSSLAMSSLTEILVIGLKLSLKVWMTFAYGRIDPSNVPLLTLCYPARSPKPHAGICRGDVVHFLLWINARTVTLLDSAEKPHVINHQTQEELKTMEISDVQLV
ncbi:vacuolar protein sorting-associated protein 8 homolog isoform X2 [Xenopus laevis]|uniref:Vacuolar protein sorting-associated protein 8 homolog isoform X2 n=1 Tax=Xenopus laevis TaxID=8355 RepID=A0A8J1M1K8_XENLA|nr:vacuolar protein sorting-associated protein 8 homolog isoform X2 [Xenopus laevis]